MSACNRRIWIPAFAGMTELDCLSSVIPAKAGIQGYTIQIYVDYDNEHEREGET
jgi:hypothetical protein